MYSKLFWKGGLSVSDQFVFSLGNFILNILLARFMTASEYGAFAIAFSLFLFSAGFSTAFFSEPLSVIGHSRYSINIKEYVGVSICMQTMFSLLLAFLFAIIMIIFRFFKPIDNVTLFSLFGVAIFTPFILFFWFLRRICYLEGDAHFALLGSFVYTISLLAGLFFAYRLNSVSPFMAFFLMAFAGVVSSIFLWRILSIAKISKYFPVHKILAFSILRDHWRYGRWIALANIANWLCGDFYLILMGIFLGISVTGAYSALENLITPLRQILSGLTLLLIPWMASQKIMKKEEYIGRNSGKLIFSNVLLGLVYSSFILICGKLLIQIFYRKSYFNDFIWLLPFLGIIGVLTALQQSLGIIVRVLERPRSIFLSKLLSSIFTLSAGILLVYKWKLYGAVAGISLGILLECMVMLYHINSKKLSKGEFSA